MISFRWSVLDEGRFSIEIKTPVTKSGTLFRFTAAIYSLGLDIDSGDVETLEDEYGPYASDRFELRLSHEIKNPDPMDVLNRLGNLMENLIRRDDSPEALLQEKGIKPPGRAWFFESPPTIVFQDHHDLNQTEFYLESLNRRGLLFHVTRILAMENINIIRGTIRSSLSGTAEDSLFLQYDGKELGHELSMKLENLIVNSDR